jgi:hypothetical protein
MPQKNRRKSFQPRATRGAFDRRILREKDEITFSADPTQDFRAIILADIQKV